MCWLYHLVHTVVLRCALVADLTVSWDMPPPPMFTLNSTSLTLKEHTFMFFSFSCLIYAHLVLTAVSQIALEWSSGNWYFLDDSKELIFLCNGTLTICTTLVEVNLNKPRAMALDPSMGYFSTVVVLPNDPPSASIFAKISIADSCSLLCSDQTRHGWRALP